jgi:Ca-activated chloride channel family protein
MKGRNVLFAVVIAGLMGAGGFVAAQDPETANRIAPAPSDKKVPDPGEKEFTIRSDVRMVLLDVSVKDPKGGFVEGLTKDNFAVYEDGKPQQITQFANQDIPVTVGIVVDESGSMRPKRPETITAALSFVTSSNPEDEVFVINFNDKVYHGLPDTVLFSDNTNMLRTALMSTAPEGRTALYDAIFASLHQLDMGRRSKKTLVVISDGGDNISTHTKRDVQHKVEQSLATIYTIGVFDSDDPDRNPDVLKWLANVSGGVSYFPQQLEGIVPVCKHIAKEIRTRYTIAYVPPDGPAGVLRHIKVVASAPDRGKLIARTRTQYIFNPDEATER